MRSLSVCVLTLCLLSKLLLLQAYGLEVRLGIEAAREPQRREQCNLTFSRFLVGNLQEKSPGPISYTKLKDLPETFLEQGYSVEIAHQLQVVLKALPAVAISPHLLRLAHFMEVMSGRCFACLLPHGCLLKGQALGMFVVSTLDFTTMPLPGNALAKKTAPQRTLMRDEMQILLLTHPRSADQAGLGEWFMVVVHEFIHALNRQIFSAWIHANHLRLRRGLQADMLYDEYVRRYDVAGNSEEMVIMSEPFFLMVDEALAYEHGILARNGLQISQISTQDFTQTWRTIAMSAIARKSQNELQRWGIDVNDPTRLLPVAEQVLSMMLKTIEDEGLDPLRD